MNSVRINLLATRLRFALVLLACLLVGGGSQAFAQQPETGKNPDGSTTTIERDEPESGWTTETNKQNTRIGRRIQIEIRDPKRTVRKRTTVFWSWDGSRTTDEKTFDADGKVISWVYAMVDWQGKPIETRSLVYDPASANPSRPVRGTWADSSSGAKKYWKWDPNKNEWSRI
jgi:hypothetical protein